jgi:hypothetical protein
MNAMDLIREVGLWGTLGALVSYAGQCLGKLNPVKYFRYPPEAKLKRTQQECVWVRPTSRW